MKASPMVRRLDTVSWVLLVSHLQQYQVHGSHSPTALPVKTSGSPCGLTSQISSYLTPNLPTRYIPGLLVNVILALSLISVFSLGAYSMNNSMRKSISISSVCDDLPSCDIQGSGIIFMQRVHSLSLCFKNSLSDGQLSQICGER
jgi:hypothetical protein